MSIPTPSAIAPLLTQRKQHELQHEAEQKALEERLAKDSDAKHKRTMAKFKGRTNQQPRKKSTSSSEPASSRSASSKPAKRSTEGTASSRKKFDPKTSSGNTKSNSPKESPSTEKKPFVRKPHLTQRLSDNEALKELQKSFPKTQHRNRQQSAKHTSRSSKQK